MGFKFRGTNFQAWDEFELEASGLTVLIGDGNEGKSSIFRALKGLVRNELGAHYVRNGAKKMSVTLEIDGREYTASRTKSGSTKYVVNPGEEKYESVGTDVPEPVQKLGLNEIRIGKDTFDPVFSAQGDPQFLLQEKPAPLNAILGAFSSTEKLEAGKREANSRMSKLNAEAATLAEQLQRAEAMKAKLAILADRGAAIQDIINEVAPVIARQEAILDVLGVLSEDRARQDQLQSLADRLVVPKTKHLETGLQELRWLGQAYAAVKKSVQLKTVLSRLPVLDVTKLLAEASKVRHLGTLIPAKRTLAGSVAWFTRVDAVIETWTAIVAQYKQVRALDDAHTRLTGLEVYTANGCVEKIEEKLGAIRQGVSQIDRLRQQEKVFTELTNALQTSAKARNEAAEISRQASTLRDREDALLQAAAEEREREYRLAHQITCPGCGDTFIPGVEGEHAHANS